MNLDHPVALSCEEIQEKLSSLSINPENSKNLESALLRINSNIPDLEFEGVQHIRKMLSKPNNSPINEIIEANIIPTIIQMAYLRNENFVIEVSWIICNIASGNSTHIDYLLKNHCLEFFDKMFDLNSLELKDQIVWGVGNISGESGFYRDLVTDSSIFFKIIQYGTEVINSNNISFIGNYIWTLSNIARAKPASSQNILSKIEPILILSLPRVLNNSDILTDLFWGLSSISESLTNISQHFTLALPLIVQHLQSKILQIQLSCLNILGNFISNVKNSWNYLSTLNILPILSNFLNDSKIIIRRETVWILANLSTESSEVVKELIELKVCYKLLEMTEIENPQIIKEIIWIFSNIFLKCDTLKVGELVRMGIVGKLIEIAIRVNENKEKCIAVEGVFGALEKDPQALNGQVKDKLVQLYGISVGDKDVLRRIDKIFERFEVVADDQESENIICDVEMDGN